MGGRVGCRAAACLRQLPSSFCFHSEGRFGMHESAVTGERPSHRLRRAPSLWPPDTAPPQHGRVDHRVRRHLRRLRAPAAHAAAPGLHPPHLEVPDALVRSRPCFGACWGAGRWAGAPSESVAPAPACTTLLLSCSRRPPHELQHMFCRLSPAVCARSAPAPGLTARLASLRLPPLPRTQADAAADEPVGHVRVDDGAHRRPGVLPAAGCAAAARAWLGRPGAPALGPPALPASRPEARAARTCCRMR